MVKKCVQLVNQFCINVCKRLSFPLFDLATSSRVGKSAIKSVSILLNFHNAIIINNPIQTSGLYTLSTIPTITTICLKRNKTINNIT